MKPFGIPKTAQTVLRLLKEAGFEAYLVGGAVRNFVMGVIPDDYDVATSALPEETRNVFERAGIRVINTGIKHGTVTVMMPDADGETEGRKTLPVEITTFRTDGAYTDRRHPDGVTFTASLEEDLARRDFTMNALAMDENGEIIDFYNGRESIRQGVISCVREPEKRLEEDALRILRALRFSATLGFRIDDRTRAAIRSEMGGLSAVSGERIREELRKLLAGKNAEAVLNEYADVFAFLFPVLAPSVGFAQKGAKHKYDVFAHIAHVVSGVSLGTAEMRAFAERTDTSAFRGPADEITLLAAFFHDIGKPAAASLKNDGTHVFNGHGAEGAKLVLPALDRLALDRETHERTRELIDIHDAKVKPEKAEIKRRMNRLGREQWLRFIRLKAADQHGLNEPFWGEEGLASLALLTDEILGNGEPYRVGDLAVSGGDLIALGTEAGPAVGKELAELLERVINGELPNEREALLRAVKTETGGKA